MNVPCMGCSNAFRFLPLCLRFIQFSGYDPEKNKSVLMAVRVHPFPSRTRQLSSLALKILGWKRPGKIRRRRHKRQVVDGNVSYLLHIPLKGL